MTNDPKCMWDVLVVTFCNQELARAARNYLKKRKAHNWLPNDLTVLCIEDPQDSLGSGGATLNALLTVTEHLSAQKGFTVVTSDVLSNSRILMMHTGRFFPFDPNSRGFLCLPLVPEDGESEFLVTNFDALFYAVTYQLALGSPPGLWVCSCDMMLKLPADFKLDWTKINVEDGIIGVSVPVTKEYAKKHGVYVVDEDFNMKDLIFQGSLECLSNYCLGDSTLPLAAGIVFFSVYATERLLATHVTPPLDACTYFGIDSGMEPVPISLYFDILLATAPDVNEEEFVKGSRSGVFGKSSAPLKETQKQFMMNARSVLWKHFRGLKLKVVFIKNGKHYYFDITQSPKEFCSALCKFCPSIHGYKFSSQVHSFVHDESSVSDSSLLINSIVDNGATVEEKTTIVHSHIASNVHVGSGCYIYGLDENSSKVFPGNVIPSNSFIIGMCVEFQKGNVKRLYAGLSSELNLLEEHLFSLKGSDTSETAFADKCLNDLIDFSITHSTMLPLSYKNVLASQGLNKHLKTVFMAKIFPIYHPKFEVDILHSMAFLCKTLNSDVNFWFDYCRSSLCDMLENVNNSSEFNYQQSLYFLVACKQIERILINNLNLSVLSLLKAFVLCKKHDIILDLLDQMAIKAVDHDLRCKRRPDISARAFACIADVLGFMTGYKAGLRSGPAANKQWKAALHLFEDGDLYNGVKKMAEIRTDWLHHSELLIRASRHYEGAEQILIRQAVKSASSFINPSIHFSLMKRNCWLVAECSARIDISGGWSDTPPICYEYGGAVVNAAVLLNGTRPIGARIRKIDSCVIRLKLLGDSEAKTHQIIISTLEQFSDYNIPQAPGSLLKTCMILAEMIDLNSDMTLQEQLQKKYQGGFELQTWSNLPRGSGLGASSILAGAVLKVVFEACGKFIDKDSLIHAVLLAEQMLTTGGGWQDQVGGLIGGFKIGRTAPKIPLHVTTELLHTSEEFFQKFSNHLKLIYTGKTRLARNLLQTVVRNWYSRRIDILNTCYNLRKTAEQCADSFKAENLIAIGNHINSYWKQKKSIASGCEPDLCKRLMDKLEPYALGMALGGAGGGGFMFVLTKKPEKNDFITSLLHEVEGGQDVVVYDAVVDKIGMVTTFQPV